MEHENDQSDRRSLTEQTKLILRSLVGALRDEELAEIEAQEDPGAGTRLAANIDPQADAIKEFLAGIIGKVTKPIGEAASATGRGVVSGAKAAPRVARRAGRATFTSKGPEGRRRSILNILAPGVFGSSFQESDLTPPSPEVQAILEAADEAAAGIQ